MLLRLDTRLFAALLSIRVYRAVAVFRIVLLVMFEAGDSLHAGAMTLVVVNDDESPEPSPKSFSVLFHQCPHIRDTAAERASHRCAFWFGPHHFDDLPLKRSTWEQLAST